MSARLKFNFQNNWYLYPIFPYPENVFPIYSNNLSLQTIFPRYWQFDSTLEVSYKSTEEFWFHDFSLHLPRSQVCPNCDTKFPTCIVTGRPLMDYQFWMCGTCKHRAYEQEINKLNHCPLCHAPIWSPIKALCVNVIPSSLTVRRVEQDLDASQLPSLSLSPQDPVI